MKKLLIVLGIVSLTGCMTASEFPSLKYCEEVHYDRVNWEDITFSGVCTAPSAGKGVF